jgi:hypothetical protein
VSFFITATSLYGQVDWVERPIATDYDGAWGIYAIDMDGDEDIDLVSAAHGADDITWWENDGNQQFIEHNIDNNWDGASEVHAGDLDGDGDIDVIGVAYGSDEIAWYENDGEMNFTKFMLVTNYLDAHFARMHDLDDDNDMDIVTCAQTDGKITWWENTGYPNFTGHEIDINFHGCRQIEVFDLDNDGDADILTVVGFRGQIAWYENDGNQVFQKHIIRGNYNAFWAKPYDFNGDSAWDILGCAVGWYGVDEDDISWFENDGNMNFSNQHIIDIIYGNPQSVEAADFDLDGDLDIAAAMSYYDGISWWENDQNTTFTKHNLSQDFHYAKSVSVPDLDRDGDPDIIGTSSYTGNISWWQNLTVLVPGVVMGVVSDYNGSPVESVYVNPLGIDIYDYTDPFGNYDLALPPAMYDITFQKPGYFDHITTDVQATASDTTILDVTMYLEMPGIWGQVINREPIPVESVLVNILNTPFTVYTDDAGQFAVVDLTGGNYDVSFSHQYYFDTTLTDIVADTGSYYDPLEVILEGKSAVTGFVGGPDSLPLADVHIFAVNKGIGDYSDNNGNYFMNTIPEKYFNYKIVKSNFFEQIISNVMVPLGETLVLDSIYLEPLGDILSVWYGNPDGSPVTAPINRLIYIDVWIQSTIDLSIGMVHLPLGTNDQYIVEHKSVTDGILYYPLDDWDDVSFYPPNYLSPGWQSQSLFGVSDIGGDPNPFLHCLTPTRICSFAFKIVNDPSLIGDTVICFSQGFHPSDGGPVVMDSMGVDLYYPFQYFSPLLLAGCPYVTGDVNGSNNYNGLDITYGVGYFKGAPDPQCSFGSCPIPPCDAFFYCGDVNASCNYNGLDITYGVNYFRYGSPGPQPCADCPPVE